MLVKEAAEYLSISTGQEITAGQLVDQLKQRFPEQKFNANSELPEQFVENIESLATKTQDTTSASQPKPSAGGMGMSAPTNGTESIVNTKASTISIAECVRQALADEEIAIAVQRGFYDALTVVDAYEGSKAQTIDAVLESRRIAQERELEELRAERDNFLIERATREQDRLGKWSVKAHQSRTRLQATRQELDDLLKLL